MKILAIDSSGLVASVAIVEDEVVVAEYTTDFKKTHSQTLLPMIDEIVEMTELELNEIDAIAISAGPGSFTGLRIGSATAKGLGLALKKPVISIPSVDALAFNLYGTSDLICPIMDARRGQVYTGIYQHQNGQFVVVEKQKAVELEELLVQLKTIGKKVIFLGDGVSVHKETIKDALGEDCSFAPAHVNKQRGAAVGVLAMQYYEKGAIESARDHQPEYLRVSQAERELAEKMANNVSNS